MANVYSLTPMTRSVNAQRRVVIQGFDLPVRGLTIAGIALVPAILVTAIMWLFLSDYALFVIPAIEGTAFWLIESRTRNGMRLRRYQRFIDMRKSVSGTFTICGRPVTPLRHRFGLVVASSTPGWPVEKSTFFSEESLRRGTRRKVPHGEKQMTHQRRH